MPNTFKQKIPTANKPKSTKSYSFDHITSQAFMMPQPIGIRPCIPNQNFKVFLQSFCRLNPLLKPTFGRARVHNRAFFVPMRTIMPNFAEFLQSEPIYSNVDGAYGLQTSVCLINNITLIDALVAGSSVVTASDPYDFSFMDNNNTRQYYQFSNTTKYMYKLLLSLGYKVNWNINASVQYSAMPILAWAKVMLDWYYPNQYINNSLVQSITPYFSNDSLQQRYLSPSVLTNIVMATMYCSYDDSIVVDAWDRPVAPNNGVESSYSIPDITMNGSTLIAAGGATISNVHVDNTSSSNGTPTPNAQYSTYDNRWPSSITQYQHDILKALTDYTKRHQLAGVRAVDRYFAEYGINLSSEIMKRSVLLGDDSFDVQFGDVMAHSDTYDANANSGAVLGDFAGKGIGLGNHQFAYQLGQEFGYFIVVNSVIPEVGYYEGVNPIVKHKSILDFWHSDFDGLGVQAMAADEVYMPKEYTPNFNDSYADYLHNQVFGFVPRYYEYKCAPSVLSGDYALRTSSADLEAMTLMRSLEGAFTSAMDIKHDVALVQGNDAWQYNRIFYNAGNKVVPENFNFIHHFEVEQTDETAPLFDTYDFKEVHRVIEAHTQSAKVN